MKSTTEIIKTESRGRRKRRAIDEARSKLPLPSMTPQDWMKMASKGGRSGSWAFYRWVEASMTLYDRKKLSYEDWQQIAKEFGFDSWWGSYQYRSHQNSFCLEALDGIDDVIDLVDQQWN